MGNVVTLGEVNRTENNNVATSGEVNRIENSNVATLAKDCRDITSMSRHQLPKSQHQSKAETLKILSPMSRHRNSES